jgi:Reverse transcriptase (RNA-dependent DNA polymerase)
MNVLPGTWAYRCKRYPDGSVRKLKARFCARGDMQIEGVDFFETYSPVANCQTVRIMLIMSVVFGLATMQVDYTAAFIHADIDRDPNWDRMSAEEKEWSGVYVEKPRGFTQPGKVLKLKRSLNGLKQAPRNFFLHLKSKLEYVGFKQSEHDQCLFIAEAVICLVYVDDTLFFAPSQEYIDDVLAKLRQTMEIEVEDDVAGFLGVHIKRNDDGTVVLTQQGLIDRCIAALGVEGLPIKHTPAEYGCLGSCRESDPAQGTYSYPSVIGMLQYLVTHTRPDLMFAVSQCARYTHSPRRKHELALERIGQYLKGTRNKGLILRPEVDGVLRIDAYVDADFAGMWGYECKQDPACVKSRTGFVIFVANCPVIWSSKLQGDIATCTMEAEYNALSISMRDVLPLQALLREIYNNIGLSKTQKVQFKTTVHKDNNGALRLAQMEPGRSTPRSKHYAIKYHWFRSKLKPNEIELVKEESKAQRADFMTKALRTDAFKDNQKLTCGW